MGIELKNNAVGYLATALSKSSTKTVLQAGDGGNFPNLGAGDYFYATLVSPGGAMEILKVTARSKDSLTIERAQENTIAQAFGLESRLELRVTAATIEEFVNQNVELGVYTPYGTAPVTSRNIRSKLHESVSILDFGAVGDGVTDDTIAIQKAIDAIYATGTYGEVLVPPSPTSNPYIFTSVTVKSKVIFRGTGGVLKLKNKVCIDTSKSYFLIHNLEHTDVVYENLIIDGNAANNKSFKVADGITAVGDNTVVRGCRVENAPDSGIMFSSCPHGRCIDNWVQNCRDAGIYVNAGEEEHPKGDMQVLGNTIKNCVYGGIGIKRSIENLVVANNIIQNCGNGITVEDFGPGKGGAPDHLLINGNSLEDIGYPYRSSPSVAEVGISLYGCTNVICSNNKINRCSGHAINLSGTEHAIVQGNHCTGYPDSPNPDPKNGNYGLGVRHRATSTAIDAKQNIISGNIFRNFFHYGGRFWSSYNVVVTNNFFSSTNGTGLRVDAETDSCNFSNNFIEGGTVIEEGKVDVELYEGADNLIWNYNQLMNSTDAWTRVGHIKNSAVPVPMGVITPRFAGQFCYMTTNGPKIYMAHGSSNTEWTQIGGTMLMATAADIADKSSDINTKYKKRLVPIWDLTNKRMLVCQAETPADPWFVVDGSGSVTPK